MLELVMANTIAQPLPATPRERLADVRGSAVKADLKAQLPATSMRAVAADAIHAVTSQKAAASDIGINEGRLSHKLKDGSLTLAQLEALGPRYTAKLGADLVERFAPLATPLAQAKQCLKDAERSLSEARDLLERIA